MTTMLVIIEALTVRVQVPNYEVRTLSHAYAVKTDTKLDTPHLGTLDP